MCHWIRALLNDAPVTVLVVDCAISSDPGSAPSNPNCTKPQPQPRQGAGRICVRCRMCVHVSSIHPCSRRGQHATTTPTWSVLWHFQLLKVAGSSPSSSLTCSGWSESQPTGCYKHQQPTILHVSAGRGAAVCVCGNRLVNRLPACQPSNYHYPTVSARLLFVCMYVCVSMYA